MDALAGGEVDAANVDGGIAVVQGQLAVSRLLAEVLDLDIDFVGGFIGNVAPDVECDDPDIIAAVADRQIADVDAGQVDRGERPGGWLLGCATGGCGVGWGGRPGSPPP